MNIKDFSKNTFSQNGEDGIIKRIFEVLDKGGDDRERWCVEFGAWDGKHLSNTFNLVRKGWNAIYIEGDEDRFSELVTTSNEYPQIIPVNAMVSFDIDSEDCLDSIVSRHPLPADFDVLSIDIDSYDLAVWHAFTGRPKVVIIEINSYIPPPEIYNGTMEYLK